jgi:hypothetical protein
MLDEDAEKAKPPQGPNAFIIRVGAKWERVIYRKMRT